jgi:hypothetical protein
MHTPVRTHRAWQDDKQTTITGQTIVDDAVVANDDVRADLAALANLDVLPLQSSGQPHQPSMRRVWNRTSNTLPLNPLLSFSTNDLGSCWRRWFRCSTLQTSTSAKASQRDARATEVVLGLANVHPVPREFLQTYQETKSYISSQAKKNDHAEELLLLSDLGEGLALDRRRPLLSKRCDSGPRSELPTSMRLRMSGLSRYSPALIIFDTGSTATIPRAK